MDVEVLEVEVVEVEVVEVEVDVLEVDVVEVDVEVEVDVVEVLDDVEVDVVVVCELLSLPRLLDVVVVVRKSCSEISTLTKVASKDRLGSDRLVVVVASGALVVISTTARPGSWVVVVTLAAETAVPWSTGASCGVAEGASVVCSVCDATDSVGVGIGMTEFARIVPVSAFVTPGPTSV